MKPPPVLECQDCGEVLKELTPEEDRQIADNPYNFIVYCKWCRPRQRPTV